jgi:hypothetical protein
MKRLSGAAVTAALAATLVLGAPVSAGGAATVRILDPIAPAVAGQPWALDLEILQHGMTPIDWEQVSLIGHKGASGEVVAGNGHPAGDVGRYLLVVTFPSAGDWTFEFGLRDLVVMNQTQETVTVGESTDVAPDPGSLTTGSPDCT